MVEPSENSLDAGNQQGRKIGNDSDQVLDTDPYALTGIVSVPSQELTATMIDNDHEALLLASFLDAQ